MKTDIQLLRNATVVINTHGLQLLIDPMFSAKEHLDPIPWSDDRRNPLVDLPVTKETLQNIINSTDVILLTHLHPDHWDEEAVALLPKTMQLICQPEDAPVLRAQGFCNLITTEQSLCKHVLVERVSAQHGHGELLDKLSPASGFVIQSPHQTIYVTGDTVWGESLQQSLQRFQPDVIIANSGAAQFNFGEPVTLNKEDVLQMLSACKPHATVVIVHMEAVNHCHLTRSELQNFLKQHQFTQTVLIPLDGELIEV
jgi:L-ascorbate metabolism protein UlaG (beta-lactamase superfamily)